MKAPGRIAQSPALGEAVWCSTFAPPEVGGGKTAVIRLEHWPSTDVLLGLARQTGVTETTFVIPNGAGIALRWFSPIREVPLCGHGALAAATLFSDLLLEGELLPVEGLPGKLWLSKIDGSPVVVLPRARLTRCPPSSFDLGIPILEVFDAGRDYLFVVAGPEQLRAVDAMNVGLAQLDKIGCIVAAPSQEHAGCFRFFAPHAGILEDRTSVSVIPALVELWAHPDQTTYAFSQESGGDVVIHARLALHNIAVGGPLFELARGRVVDGQTVGVTREAAVLSGGACQS